MRLHRVLLVCATAVAVVGLGVVGIGLSPAGAASNSDLQITQTATDSTVSGETTVVIKVLNKGPDAAGALNLTNLATTTGAIFKSASTPASRCGLSPAPTGYSILVFCQTSTTLASGATWTLTLRFVGAAGKPFSNFASVGGVDVNDTVPSNNSSTLKSYFGPAADLQVTQATVLSPSAGTAKIAATVKNNGPWTAKNLQYIVEIASPSFQTVFEDNPSWSCQFIPPASGYNSALSCTAPSLAPGASAVMNFSYTGTAGGTLKHVGAISASTPADPVPANNSATTNTTYRYERG